MSVPEPLLLRGGNDGDNDYDNDDDNDHLLCGEAERGHRGGLQRPDGG